MREKDNDRALKDREAASIQKDKVKSTSLTERPQTTAKKLCHESQKITPQTKRLCRSVKKLQPRRKKTKLLSSRRR